MNSSGTCAAVLGEPNTWTCGLLLRLVKEILVSFAKNDLLEALDRFSHLLEGSAILQGCSCGAGLIQI